MDMKKKSFSFSFLYKENIMERELGLSKPNFSELGTHVAGIEVRFRIVTIRDLA